MCKNGNNKNISEFESWYYRNDFNKIMKTEKYMKGVDLQKNNMSICMIFEIKSFLTDIQIWNINIFCTKNIIWIHWKKGRYGKRRCQKSVLKRNYKEANIFERIVCRYKPKRKHKKAAA